VTNVTAEALELPPDQRAAWLDRACAGDDDLRRNVESLIAADARAGAFLETPALAADGAAETVAAIAQGVAGLADGASVGPYRIVRELGHGGMGVVYLAERADAAFEKRVAIKIVRADFSRDASRRFHDERRILATLEHPNIARLLDGGSTSSGISYFVMEYVDGAPVDTYCESARLPLPARLALFRQICAAVQYAHQRLVIHRDIKPRNILVTADGTPKLLDFGIAKLLDSGLAPDETQTGLRPFTLGNSSPEQVRGVPMTVTSDVYSLGVLLYRLVTGHGPYGPAPLNDAMLIRAICDEPPVSPAQAARAGTGFSIGADLECILLKALRKEPERRYESVDQFAEDVRRLLDGRPVLAAPDSPSYRARKFVARHRLAVAAAAVAAISLIGGIGATTWQARRANQQRAIAEQRLQQTRRLANAMVFEVNDALAAGTTSARTLLLTRASEQLDALAADLPDDPVLAEELATAYHRLGDVLGNSGGPFAGNRAAGRANHRKGLAIRRRIAARAPNDLEARFHLVTSLVSTAYAEDEVAPSFEHARAAVDLAQSLFDARPGEVRFRRQLAGTLQALGAQHREMRETAPALEYFERATPHFEAVYKAQPTADVRAALTQCYRRLGAIRVEQQEFAQARTYLQKAIELDTITFNERPTAARARRDLSTSMTQLGWAIFNAGDAAEALPIFRRALALREALLADDPTNAQAPRDVALALWYIATAESKAGNHQVAVAAMERAAAMKLPKISAIDDLPARITGTLAGAYEKVGRLHEAIELRRKSLTVVRAAFAAQPTNKGLRHDVIREARGLGEALATLAPRDAAHRTAVTQEACAAFSEGLRVFEGLKDPTPIDTQAGDALRKHLEQCPAASRPAAGVH
jgi:tetratricopeptide (TPR) repeat protein